MTGPGRPGCWRNWTRSSTRGWSGCGGTTSTTIGRYRRNSKDYERLTASSEATIKMSAIHHLLRRLRPDLAKKANPFNYPRIARKAV